VNVAKQLESQFGLSAEMIDIRFINPLNYGKIVESVKKTGKLLLASDAAERNSFLHCIASNIQTLAFDYLDAPVAVVGSRNWITPAAEMEELYFPQEDWLIDAIHERILPLPGYVPVTVQTMGDLLRRNRQGV
jgi:2-oxoisovalerate dehydrogenase E1 component